MKMLSALSIAALLSIVLSCSNQASEEGANAVGSVNEYDTAEEVLDSTVAEKNSQDRKFIRTADIRFRVKDVAKTTERIEHITSAFGGFITLTQLNSSIDRTTTTPVTADSSLECTYYTVSNDISLRVPNTYLDTVTYLIAKEISFLNSRTIKADEVSFQLLANKMARSRADRNTRRMENVVKERRGKVGEVIEAEDRIDEKAEQRDEAIVNHLALTDQVNFSTVSLSLYQRPSISKEMVLSDKIIEPFQPGLGARLLDSLKTGWQVVEVLFLFVVKLWGVLVLAIFGYFVWKRFKAKSAV